MNTTALPHCNHPVHLTQLPQLELAAMFASCQGFLAKVDKQLNTVMQAVLHGKGCDKYQHGYAVTVQLA